MVGTGRFELPTPRTPSGPIVFSMVYPSLLSPSVHEGLRAIMRIAEYPELLSFSMLYVTIFATMRNGVFNRHNVERQSLVVSMPVSLQWSAACERRQCRCG